MNLLHKQTKKHSNKDRTWTGALHFTATLRRFTATLRRLCIGCTY